MRVSVVRGGGVAGISTRTELSASALSSEDAQTFADKVDGANLRDEPPARSGQGWPDQMLYELVLDDGESEVRVQFSDENLPEDARRLIEWISSRPERSHGTDR